MSDKDLGRIIGGPSGIKKTDIKTVRPNITSVFNPEATGYIPQPKQISTKPIALNSDGKPKSLTKNKVAPAQRRNLPQESSAFANRVKTGSSLMRVVKSLTRTVK